VTMKYKIIIRMLSCILMLLALRLYFEPYNEFICEESKNDEFQYVIYFKDSTIDPFRYCFAFDQMGGYYHRLLDYDYQKVIGELD